MDNYSKEVKDILRWGQIGMIACRIAERTGWTPLESLKEFFRSETCAKYHDRHTGLYLYSEGYLADEYLIEKGLYRG